MLHLTYVAVLNARADLVLSFDTVAMPFWVIRHTKRASTVHAQKIYLNPFGATAVPKL